LKEVSRLLELLVLEPEKNRLIFQLNNNSNLKELKKRLMFCSKNPIKNKNLIVTSVSIIKKKKKRIVEKHNSFFRNYILSFCFDDFFFNTNFYSTFPELILLRTLFQIFLWISSNPLIFLCHSKLYKDNCYLIELFVQVFSD